MTHTALVLGASGSVGQALLAVAQQAPAQGAIDHVPDMLALVAGR